MCLREAALVAEPRREVNLEGVAVTMEERRRPDEVLETVEMKKVGEPVGV